MATVNGLWIQITDALYTAYNTAANADILHDDGSAKWLRLRLLNGYDDEIVQQGESGYLFGISSAVNRHPQEQRNISFSTDESRECVFAILGQLLNTERIIRDYVIVDPADIGTGYSTRTMNIRQCRPNGQSMSDGTTRHYHGGFTVRLEAVVLV